MWYRKDIQKEKREINKITLDTAWKTEGPEMQGIPGKLYNFLASLSTVSHLHTPLWIGSG